MKAKIKIRNIYYMLTYAFQSLHETGIKDVQGEDFDHIHDLFAAILVNGINKQLKQGLYRDYVKHEEALAGLRGKIQIAETIKQQVQIYGKLVCVFDEFTEDSPHNRVLKSVMLFLLRYGDIKDKNRKNLRRLLSSYFAKITEISPVVIRWDSLKYHRNNVSYRMLIGICRLTVEGLLQTDEAGNHKLTAWLQNEKMSKLYQNFVLAYYERNYPRFSPKASRISWGDVDGQSDYLPDMITDITLENKKNDKCLIIDTKYYKSGTMQTDSRYDSLKYISENLYQIYAYVKNYKGTKNVAGMLLYAKTDETITPNEELVIHGNTFWLKALDLNQEWEEITKQLDQHCRWLEESPP